MTAPLARLADACDAFAEAYDADAVDLAPQLARLRAALDAVPG